MARLGRDSIEIDNDRIHLKWKTAAEQSLLCGACRAKHKKGFKNQELDMSSSLNLTRTFCPLCGQEMEIFNYERTETIDDVVFIQVMDSSYDKYKDIIVIDDLHSHPSHPVMPMTRFFKESYQVPTSIKNISKMLKGSNLIRIGNTWIHPKLLETCDLYNDGMSAVINLKGDAHFYSGSYNDYCVAIYFDIDKFFSSLIKHKIFITGNFRRMTVDFYKEYYEPYRETMEREHPEIMLLNELKS